MPADSLEQVVSLCKRRGFIFPGSAIYGGLANTWDFGPLGVELARNIKQEWWESMIYRRDDVEGIECAIMMNRKVWKYSGHEGTFNDPLVDNKKTKKRYRLDHLLEAQTPEMLATLAKTINVTLTAATNEENVVVLVAELFCYANAGEILTQAKVLDKETKEPGDWTAPRQFNLMFSTYFGASAEGDEDAKVYLRPETAQGMFVNFNHVAETMRRKLPFGIAQIGRSFRNEITPGNFIFRTREFDQMEMEFFVAPPLDDGTYPEGETSDDDWHAHWVEARYNWYTNLGIAPERLRKRVQAKAELAHYAKACTDIEYQYPGSLGFAEVEGIANRTDYDLTAHSKSTADNAAAKEHLKLPENADSTEVLSWFDPQRKQHLVPYVIEPAAGVARPFLAFLCDAFTIEKVKDVEEAEAQKLTDALNAFLKSAAKSEHLAEADKAAIAAKGTEILAGGQDAFPSINALLGLDGADKIELAKKLRSAAERVLDASFRTVLKLHPRLAPIKVAIFPLKKNEDRIVTLAKELRMQVQRFTRAVYDDTGAIGKLYRRQDEIGTPFCITVDFQSLEDGTVTVRSRDSMEQVRVHRDQLTAWLIERLA